MMTNMGFSFKINENIGIEFSQKSGQYELHIFVRESSLAKNDEKAR